MQIVSVSQINMYIKSILDSSEPLKNVVIIGEISNFSHYPSGHMYLTLKDEKSRLKSVMFKTYSSRLQFQPSNGMSVICRGYISVYEQNGEYQLYIVDMQPEGVGALNLAFEQLKDKLQKEGLFDSNNKKTIPKYPKKVGVITSNKGAAIEDIKKILKSRFPLANVVVVPTAVQGKQSAESIAQSIEFINTFNDVDVLIVGRGGGSLEDLWGFNTEIVARAVFNSKIPVISAVGHENDYTICDLVADLRASTPSNAVELAVPDMFSELVSIANYKNSLKMLIDREIDNRFQKLDFLSNSSVLKSAELLTQNIKTTLIDFNNKMNYSVEKLLTRCSQQLSKNAAILNSLSPLAVLGRGYSITFLNDCTVNSVNKIHIKDNIDVRLTDGIIKCTVNEVVENE